MGASLARSTRKLTQMYMGSFDVQSIGQPANSKPWAAHGANNEDSDDIRMEGFATLAGGNMPIYATANRLMFGIGDGSPNPAQDVFAVTKRVEPFMKDSVPVTYVSIVPTWESLELYRRKQENWNVMMSEGFLLAMLDERIAADVNPSLELTPEWRGRLRSFYAAKCTYRRGGTPEVRVSQRDNEAFRPSQFLKLSEDCKIQ